MFSCGDDHCSWIRLTHCNESRRAAITLLAVMDNPTAFFLLSSIVICVGCLSILLPIFIPKYLERHTKEPSKRKAQNMMRRQQKSNSHNMSDKVSFESCDGSGYKLFASQPVAIRRTVSNPSKKKSIASVEAGSNGQPSQVFSKSAAVVTKAILTVHRPVVEGVTTSKNALISSLGNLVQPLESATTSRDEPVSVSEIEPANQHRSEEQEQQAA